MTHDLFGKKVITEESFEILYTGSSFRDGKILIKPLYVELQSLECILKEAVEILVESGKLSPDTKEFQIYVEIEKGSIYEKIKVIFKNPKTYLVMGLLVPFLNS